MRAPAEIAREIIYKYGKGAAAKDPQAVEILTYFLVKAILVSRLELLKEVEEKAGIKVHLEESNPESKIIVTQ